MLMYFLTAYDGVPHIAFCTYQRAAANSGGGRKTYRLQVVRTYLNANNCATERCMKQPPPWGPQV